MKESTIPAIRPRVSPLRLLTLNLSALALLVSLFAPCFLRADDAGIVTWARGVEGQRQADLGNGFYLNPILPGDHPDPSLLKDGDDFYLVHSSFEAYPGLVVWQSRDLVNWQPVGPALKKNVGSVWAPDLIKYRDRYYIYFPAKGKTASTNYVVWADDIRGPWSEPIDLKIGRIDPGHAVGRDGKRYLFLSGGMKVPLSDDGISAAGPASKVYDGWAYPEDWVVESFSQEGPKIAQHGDFYYMVLAEGGTAGPATSHMVVVARAKSLDGPWENDPHNPVVRTTSAEETWWSKGHATLFEGPAGQWYLIYHAYEKGYYTLGRQTLLEPVVWTDEGWFKRSGFDPAKPIPKPKADAGVAGRPLSDDFSTNKMGGQWSFFQNAGSASPDFHYKDHALVIAAQGTSPANCSPLTFVCGDLAYEVEVEVEISPHATAEILTFYSNRLYAGLGVSDRELILHRYGQDRAGEKPKELGRHFFLKLRNDRNVVTLFTRADGGAWVKFGTQMDVSGYHHNVAGGFMSLRPGLYAAGDGAVTYRNLKYRALP